MIEIWLRIWEDYNSMFIDGVHICTQLISFLTLKLKCSILVDLYNFFSIWLFDLGKP
jgi:hypothetical protein